MPRRLKLDIPGPDRRVTPGDVLAKGWAELFATQAPEGHAQRAAGERSPRAGAAPLRMVLEIGFGRGEFLIDLAQRAPAVAHVGVEISRKRVLKQARRLAKSEIANVRLVHGTGEQALADLVGPASLEAVWINFSDPWPKKRHHRRRLVQAPLVAAVANRLKRGGMLHVATDDVPYAEHIDAVLAAESQLENAFAPARWLADVPGRMPTGYELEWRAEGRPLHFFAYQRISG
jgi:tRNA (guanine-N7-)-methyltransferase